MPLPDVFVAAPEYIEKYKPKVALRLTRAAMSVSFTVDKINYYADVLTTFDNDDLALTDRVNEKIAKWGAFHDKVEKSMEILVKIAPKKKGNTLLNAETAAGFLSSSEPLSSSQFETLVLVWSPLSSLHLHQENQARLEKVNFKWPPEPLLTPP
jgi:hypothetical protein